MSKMTRLLLGVLCLASAGSARADDAAPSASYVPGLGEFMMATQARHAKLWFAGQAENWRLAAYELDEIKEGLDDAGRWNPTFQDLQIRAMIEQNLGGPLADVGAAITKKDRAAFTAAFDKLSGGCNACHAGAGHDFIAIQRPTTPPATNQVYEPKP